MKQQNWLEQFNKDFPHTLFYVHCEGTHDIEYVDDAVREWVETTVTSLLEEQKKELREIVMKRFYSFNDKEKDFQCNQRVLKLRNTIQEDFNKLNK